jgi:hypothetical protein
MMPDDPPRYYTVDTCASIFDRSKKTIRRWCRQGTLRAKKDQVSGQLYIPAEAVEDRLEDLEDRGPPGDMPDAFRQDAAEPAREREADLEPAQTSPDDAWEDEGERGDTSAPELDDADDETDEDFFGGW